IFASGVVGLILFPVIVLSEGYCSLIHFASLFALVSEYKIALYIRSVLLSEIVSSIWPEKVIALIDSGLIPESHHLAEILFIAFHQSSGCCSTIPSLGVITVNRSVCVSNISAF